MSALGQKRTSESAEAMSALPPKADIGTQSGNVRFVPKADSCTAAIDVSCYQESNCGAGPSVRDFVHSELSHGGCGRQWRLGGRAPRLCICVPPRLRAPPTPQSPL